MLIAPATSSYYVDTLHLSYTDITLARFLSMGLGVASSSYLWNVGLAKIPLLKLTIWVLFGFSLFPLTLLLAGWNALFVYGAFFLYGIAQAGSHLIWNLSGTFFAGEGSSAPYTRANLLMHALRGAVMPLIGGWLCDLIGATSVLGIGALMSVFGGLILWRAIKSRDGIHALARE